MPSTSDDMDSSFTSYHMKCINWFRWTGLTRSVIRKDDIGGYYIKTSPILCQIVFFTYLINTFSKLTFLTFMVTGHLGPLEFLDRICGLDYLLCGGMVCLAFGIWLIRYPLYEVIYRLWEIENRIYRKLGSPRQMKWETEEKHSVTIWAHVLLTILGCCSLTIQFYEAPKYCVFTYSLIEADNSILRAVFCFHEALFLSHAWAAMSCSNGLCSFEAVNLSCLIKQMSEAVNDLSLHQTFVDATGFSMGNSAFKGSYTEQEGRSNSTQGYGSNQENDGEQEEDYTSRTMSFRFNNTNGGESIANSVENLKGNMKQKSRNLRNSSKTMKFGSGASRQYSIKQILYDYQQLMLISERFNSWVSYKIVGLSICGFCQYISSTTMAFQVLRMPGTGIGDIWFYIQDCTVATYVTFRVFDYMSIVLPASEEFLGCVRRYMATKGVINKRFRAFVRALKPVSLKLGPSPLRRETVLDTMEMLASYYVCVALW